MTDRHTVLITGGTGSLGFQTAKAILTMNDGWNVVITGRSAAAAEDAAVRLGSSVTGLPLDLSSLEEVRRFAHDLPSMHAVVCNAGIQTVSGTALTKDGIEQTFGVNHLAHFLLVHELLPHMAMPGRVVFVASDTHDPSKHTGMPAPVYTDARSLAYPAGNGTENPRVTGQRRYTTSKLCNVLTTYEFAQGSGEQGNGQRLRSGSHARHRACPRLLWAPGVRVALCVACIDCRTGGQHPCASAIRHRAGTAGAGSETGRHNRQVFLRPA